MQKMNDLPLDYFYFLCKYIIQFNRKLVDSGIVSWNCREEISQEQKVVAGKMHGKSSEGQTNSRPIVLALYNSQTRIHKK